MRSMMLLLVLILFAILGGLPLALFALAAIGVYVASAWAIIVIGIGIVVAALFLKFGLYLAKEAWRNRDGIVRPPISKEWKAFYPEVAHNTWKLDDCFAYEENGNCYIYKTLTEVEHRRGRSAAIKAT